MSLPEGWAARAWVARLLVAWVLGAGRATAAEPLGGIADPRAQGGWIADAAGVIPADAAARMNARITAVHRVRGPGVIVITTVVVPTTSAGGAQGTAALARAALATWKPGSKGAADGVVVALGVAERSVDVAAGEDLKVALPEGAIRRVVIERLRPYAQRRAFADAAETAVDWVVARLEQDLRELPPSLPEVAVQRHVNTRTLLLVSGAIGVVLGLALAALWGAEFLQRPACPACGRRAVVHFKEVLLAPTAEVEGVEVIELRCQACRWSRRQQKAMPRATATADPGASPDTRVERTHAGTTVGERRTRRGRRRDDEQSTEVDAPSGTVMVGGSDSLTSALPLPAPASHDAAPGSGGDPDENPFRVPEDLAERPTDSGGDR